MVDFGLARIIPRTLMCKEVMKLNRASFVSVSFCIVGSFSFSISQNVCYVEPQITGETVGEVRPVADMHQRKAEMARHSDCFIALPGPHLHNPNPRFILCFNSFLMTASSPSHFFRWVWNSGGIAGSHHLGAAWNP